MSTLQKKIQSLAKTYSTEFIDIRHHLHAHPELSYQEFETSRFVQHKLTQFGIPYTVTALLNKLLVQQGVDVYQMAVTQNDLENLFIQITAQ